MPKRELIVITSIFLIYGLLLSFFSHQGFPNNMNPGLFMPYLSDKPVGEDGFYLLTAAWNLAAKHKLVYNFDKNITGIQPLITIFYAIVASIVQLFNGDKFAFVRMVIVFNVLNLLIFAHVLGLIAHTLICNCKSPRNHRIYVTAFVITTFNFGLFSLFTYGLETGLYLTFIALCFLMTLKFSEMKTLTLRQAITFGILCGFTGLCRIDFGIVLFFLLGSLILQRRIKLTWALTTGFFALLIVSPWFIWIHYVSGRWMPSSGVAEAEVINKANALDRLMSVIGALKDLSIPWFSTQAYPIRMRFFLLFVIIFVWFIRDSKFFRSLLTLPPIKYQYLYNWLLACAPLCFIYYLFYRPTYFYMRYFSPILIVLLPLIAISLNEKMEKKSLHSKQVSCVLCVLFFCFAYLNLHNGKIIHTEAVVAGFIKNKFKQSQKIGVFESGIIGFFNQNIVNLDGKMNFHVLKMYHKKWQLYLDKEKIDVIVGRNSSIYWNLTRYNEEDNFFKFWEYHTAEFPDNGKTDFLVRKKLEALK